MLAFAHTFDDGKDFGTDLSVLSLKIE